MAVERTAQPAQGVVGPADPVEAASGVGQDLQVVQRVGRVGIEEFEEHIAVVGQPACRDPGGDDVGRDEHAGRRRTGARRHGDAGYAVHRPRGGRRTGQGDEVRADRAGAAAFVEAVDEPGQTAGGELDVVVGPQPADVPQRTGQPQRRVDGPELSPARQRESDDGHGGGDLGEPDQPVERLRLLAGAVLHAQPEGQRQVGPGRAYVGEGVEEMAERGLVGRRVAARHIGRKQHPEAAGGQTGVQVRRVRPWLSRPDQGHRGVRRGEGSEAAGHGTLPPDASVVGAPPHSRPFVGRPVHHPFRPSVRYP